MTDPLLGTYSSKTVVLKDGREAIIRPIIPADRLLLEKAWLKLSQDTIRKRFLAAKKGMSSLELDNLTVLDHINHCAYGVTTENELGEREGIGVARFVRDENNSSLAEFAIVIVDQYQALGVGTLLMTELLYEARKKGISQLTGKMDVSNVPMKKLLKKWPYFSFVQDSPGVLQVLGKLPVAT